ncbi:peptidase S10 [Aliiglaciecola sp. 3_MG-2023]|uniref:S10 family peptidase n=1 Tax=Aliiglaciecola sp. 3_MG-2023 TaxID=3062644 RepID=UPI0026E4686C|nr:peptidase S10 [Aliiglaciecola sp. 3_MG-2023]MDO6695173.1 peptidase S10 [Aliiglaciecola sp. 3_MG-2023]
MKKIILILTTTLFLTLHADAKEESSKEVKQIPEAQMSVTEHKGKFNGTTVKYKVSAGDSHLLDAKGKPKASIFHIAYTRTDVKNAESRPLLFVFNGGPGSSSVWMHMGLFGPKRVVLPSDAEPMGAAPFNLKDNPLSLLDIADLVFIDPVGTGFSKPLGEYEGKAFWGVKEDAEILSEFVRVYITENNRWNSPKFLAGESYGTTRAGAMVKELQEGWGSIDLNGILLISSIIDFQTGDFTEGNDLPYVTFLPTYAATAWYHNKVPNKSQWNNLQEFLADTRDFALNEYASVLLKGALAKPEEVKNVVNKLHTYTGLKKQYIEQSKLRISEFLFMKELMRDEGKAIGRLDSRYLGEEANIVAGYFEADPSSYAIDGAYTAAIQHYFANDINVKRSEQYHILSGEVFMSWNWLYEKSARSQGFMNVTPFISKGMRQNKDFRVFVANGYYDLATPFFATEHSMNHHGIDLSRVTMKYYEAGHMMYIHEPSFKALVKDMRAFILP